MAEIVIRDARPDDYDRLIDFIRRILVETGAQKADIFGFDLWRWQCLTPGFETLVVVAEDGGQIVGCFHLVSKPMTVSGSPGRAALLQELAVLPDYRRRGVFMQMAEYARARVAELGWDVTYSMPNLRSYPGFVKHQGYRLLAWVPIRVRPLQVGRFLSDRLPLKRLWLLSGRLVSGLYDFIFPLRSPVAGEEIAPIDRFTSEVDPMAHSVVGQTGIGLVRDARFLNWRFLDKPTSEYRAWGLRRAGQLLAYVVTRQARLFNTDCLLLMDWGYLPGEEQALLALIAHRLRAGREDKAALAVTMGFHPFFRRMGRLGFVAAPERLNPHPIPLIAQRHTDRISDEVYNLSRWLITLADWDVL